MGDFFGSGSSQFQRNKGFFGAGGSGPVPPAGDPFFSFVVLLAHCDGADGGSIFLDSSSYARTITLTNIGETDTAQFKYAPSSALIDGSTDDRIAVAMAPELDMDVNHQWTIEGYYRYNSGTRLLFYQNSFTSLYPIRIQAGASLSIDGGETGTGTTAYQLDTISIGTLPVDTWIYFAVVRDGGNFYLFVDPNNSGVASLVDTASYAGDLAITANPFRIVQGQAVGDVWCDELRWTMGVARYTAPFPTPVLPFPDFA